MRLTSVLAGLTIGLLLTGTASAQLESNQISVVGAWAGTLVIGRDSYAVTFNLTRGEDSYGAALSSPQLGIYGMPAESVKLENNRITIRLDILAAEYTGRLKMDESGSQVDFIDGEWFQEGEMVPIILRPSDAM